MLRTIISTRVLGGPGMARLFPLLGASYTANLPSKANPAFREYAMRTEASAYGGGPDLLRQGDAPPTGMLAAAPAPQGRSACGALMFENFLHKSCASSDPTS